MISVSARWNRFVAYVYHVTHGLSTNDHSVEHLRQCKYCSNCFEKWKEDRIKEIK